MTGLSKAFGSTRALKNASFDLRPGEVHALVGENGSGKSTLVKILSGVHAQDAGEVELHGEVVAAARTPSAAMARGVVTVFQEVLVADACSALDNVWLGSGPVYADRVSRADKQRLAREILTELRGESLDLSAPVEDLSLSDRQVCSIARALLRDPQVLILDEATSSLDVATRDRLFAILRRLTRSGVGIILITHRLDEITEIGDRVTVIRAGETVATLQRQAWTPDDMVRLMTGAAQLVEEASDERDTGQPGKDQEIVLSARKLSLGRGASAFDLDICAGELVGVAGLEGHGQDEFLEALRGEIITAGEVVVHRDQTTHRLRSASNAADLGIAYVPRERGQATFSWMSILENFGIRTLAADSRRGWLSRSATRDRFAEWKQTLNITFGEDRDAITTLSGGNQQKVLIARWLAARPSLLLLNDPTRGIDIGTKRELYRLLIRLAKRQNVAIVMLSSELDEHVELMDRVLVFREFELVRTMKRKELSRQSLVSAFFGETSSDPDVDRAQTAETTPPTGLLPSAVNPGTLRRTLARHSFLFSLVLAITLLIVNLARTSDFGWQDQLASFAPLALAAMASTPAIISGGGGFDLSISPLMSLVNVVFVFWLAPHGLGGAGGVALVLLLGALMGSINGFLILLARVPPIVATLSTYFILIGVDLEIAGSPKTLHSSWMPHLAGAVGPVPGGLITIGVAALVWLGLGLIPYRRTLMAVGSNDVAAFSAGVNVALVRVCAYAIGGLIAAIGGLALTALTSSAEGTTTNAYTLVAIASVALGGTSLWGGRGGVIRSISGAACIYLLQELVSSTQISSSWLQVVYGAVLVIAVMLASLTTSARGTS